MQIYRCQLCNASINKLYFRDHLMYEHKIKNDEYMRKTEDLHKQKFFSDKVTQTDKKSNTPSKIARISPSTALALTEPSASVFLSGSLPIIRLSDLSSDSVAVLGSTTASRPVAVLAPSSKPVAVAGPSKSQSVPGPKPEAILRSSLKPIAVPLQLLTNTEPSNQLNKSDLESSKSKTSAFSSNSSSSTTFTKVSSESLSNDSSLSSSSSNTGLLYHGNPSTSNPISSIVVDTPIVSSEPLDGSQDTLDTWSPPVSSQSKEMKNYQEKFRKFLEDHLSSGEKRNRDYVDISLNQPVLKKCKITVCLSPKSYIQDKTDILRDKRKVLRESNGEIREDRRSLVSSFSSPTEPSSSSRSRVPSPGSDKTSSLLVGSRERSSSKSSGSIVTVHEEGLKCIKSETASPTSSPYYLVEDGLVEDDLVEDGVDEDGVEMSFDAENSNRTRNTKPNQIDKLSQKSGASVHPMLKFDVKIPNHPLTVNQLRQAKRDMKALKKPILKVSVPRDNESARITDLRIPVRQAAINPANDLNNVGKWDIHRNHVVLLESEHFSKSLLHNEFKNTEEDEEETNLSIQRYLESLEPSTTTRL